MRGKDIPMETWYSWDQNNKRISYKRPKYYLVPKAEEMAKQERLKKTNFLRFYYGLWCEKCCDCYPKFFTEGSFEDFGYYVCLVCGKESKHMPMTWQCRDAWNSHQYKWSPDVDGYQFTLFDYMEQT